MRWDADADPDLAGYEVGWRETRPAHGDPFPGAAMGSKICPIGVDPIEDGMS